MLNYIKSEYYRTFHRMYYWMAMGIVILLYLTFIGISIAINRSGGGLEGDLLLGMTTMMIPAIGLYATVLMTDIGFSDEYKHLTMKNSIAFGTPRSVIYLGKWVMALTLSLFSAVLLLGLIVLTAKFCFPADPESFLQTLKTMLQQFVLCLPIWIGGLSVAMMCVFLCKSNLIFVLLFFSIVSILDTVFQALGALWNPVFESLRFFTLNHQIALISSLSIQPENAWMTWAVGLGYAALSTAIGLIFFQKREIK